MMTGAGTYALLTDGATVEIRPAAAGDADAVREMHAGLSPENMYLRFFTVSAQSAEREATRAGRSWSRNPPARPREAIAQVSVSLATEM